MKEQDLIFRADQLTHTIYTNTSPSIAFARVLLASSLPSSDAIKKLMGVSLRFKTTTNGNSKDGIVVLGSYVDERYKQPIIDFLRRPIDSFEPNLAAPSHNNAPYTEWETTFTIENVELSPEESLHVSIKY